MFSITLESFVRIITVGILAYVGLVFFLLISGKRSLTQLNAFDLVVTVAIGSVLSTILLNKDVSLLEGLLAFVLLILLQFLLTFTSVRWKKFNKVIKSEPSLLYLNGSFLRETMKKERISEGDILQSVRNDGIGDLKEVKAIVLENDGSLSIISGELGNTLANVSLTREG
ncbi:DUF421 domain-containing protein [Solibacillus silvestris]